MARRRDGTARRYDFQVFSDHEQGRLIAERLEQVQTSGGSVADFIREALWFFIQSDRQGSRTAASDGVSVEREISALWHALKTTPRTLTSEPVMAEAASGSSGLDMSQRRRPREVPRLAREGVPGPAMPAFDANAARESLIHSIKAFGQATRQSYGG